MNKYFKYVVLFLFPWAMGANGALVEINPLSYSVLQATDCGSYCYHDETGSQLIDGLYGTHIWQADLGNGNAYEWLGWTDDSVYIVFDFGALTMVNEIIVGTVQDRLNDVVFPSISVGTSVDGVTWGTPFHSLYVPENTANNLVHGDLTLSALNQTARYFVLNLEFSLDGPWTFTDEVDFYQNVSVSVPAPNSFVLLTLGLAILGLRRKR
ncbi:PEP-CTERM sorting domain-containing protein [Alteromonas sp. 14N.309.X.WAT.G.H12]|uniref:PEP-CTERM sorting domain-containing protein n=1 Tax=Alteromonas sp. 14N.309.X.WAT.G.H12 TaxID=3120824 RepID=UPI002FD486D6